MHKPLVSVALCTYNGADYLKEQVNSLLNQTYSPLEIIAVDDCSTDNTATILKEYEQQYPNFKVYINEQNLGYNKNFERAFSLCQGDYIAISDQDDIWLPEKIEVLMNHIGNYSLIYSNSARIGVNGEDLGTQFLDRHVTRYKGNDPRVFIMSNIVSGHALLFNRNLLENALPLPVGIVYDWWLAMVGTNKNGINVIDLNLVKHREHHTNIGKTLGGKSKQERLTDLKRRVDQILHLKQLQHRAFFEKFDKLLKKTPNGGFRLFCFGFRYQKVLCSLSTKSSISKFNHLRRWLL